MYRALALLVIAFLIGGLTALPAAADDTPAPAIFFTPHQDDETLSMGADIVNHVKAGRRVIVVLMTDGVNTSVGRTRYREWSNDDAKIAERDREFIAATKRLGAEPVIWAPNGVRAHDGGSKVGAEYGTQGNLTTPKIQAAYNHYHDLYPDAAFKTMSYYDSHQDHKLMGKVLRDMPGTWDRRYYVKIEDRSRISGHYTCYRNIDTALLDYKPIGWLSVKSDFEHEYGTPYSRNKWHK